MPLRDRVTEKILEPIRVHRFQPIHFLLELFPRHLVIMHVDKITLEIGNRTVFARFIGICLQQSFFQHLHVNIHPFLRVQHIRVFQLRTHSHAHATVISHTSFPRRSLLRGNHDDTVCRTRTVNSRGSRVLQHVDRLDIIHVHTPDTRSDQVPVIQQIVHVRVYRVF